MKSSKKWYSFTNVVILIVCMIAVADWMHFNYMCDRIRNVASELDGRLYSIGGWPIGCEYNMVFDHMLSEDDFRRFVAAVPEARRIHLQLSFHCKIPKDRLDTMQKMVASHHRIGMMVYESQNSENQNSENETLLAE